MKRSYKVIDESGVHARPAALIVNVANKYPDSIDIAYKGKTLTLKSIMLVMSLGIQCGDSFDIIISGDNEETALNEIEAILVENAIV
ncbi:Phosphocarrier protein HPr [Candidatus Izimaplasma bacterium HR1]|jgi:phosphocarrier protein|uniref:HPr family phosphocarrier protein n=1 Tax=Candidatus Izimoplasma sp. HR1 TaxID=1541959 RepID=UPI0004F624AF|nr:Phosphocarrier protein HPr [Candidatus Izimaplasma bacterium HR1]